MPPVAPAPPAMMWCGRELKVPGDIDMIALGDADDVDGRRLQGFTFMNTLRLARTHDGYGAAILSGRFAIPAPIGGVRAQCAP